MRRPLVLAVGIALGCVACVHFQSKPLDPARRAAVLSGRRLDSRTWTLNALTEEAFSNSADIALARAQYATARSALVTAGERPNPTIALTPQVVTPYAKWISGTYGVDFDWTFETAGKRSRRMDVASEQARAAAANVIDVTWKVRAAVRRAFLELYAAERKATLIEDASKKQAEVLGLIADRVKAGAVSSLETSQPRMLAAQLRLQGSDAAKSAAMARAALAEALSMSMSGISNAKFSFAEFDDVPAKRLAQRKAALTHRADVIAALAEYAATEAALRLEIAKQYPDIHLNPGYQLDAGENKWALGIGLTLPILNQNKGPIWEAEGKRREAAAKFDTVQTRVLAECDRATAAVAAARAKLGTANELITEQDHQIESFRRILAAGEGDKISLVSAEVERATTKLSQLDAIVELHGALGALEEATQTPLNR